MSQKLARDCIRQYESALNPADASCAIGHFPIDENVLRDAHASTQATVLALFDRLAPTAPAVTTVFRKKIEVRTLLREFVRAQARLQNNSHKVHVISCILTLLICVYVVSGLNLRIFPRSIER